MDDLSNKIINLLFLSGESTNAKNISNILEIEESQISEALPQVKAKLEGAGLSLIDHNNEIIIVSRPEYADINNKWMEYELKSELTPAQLQTLTIVAYMGPINNANVSFIRGVQSSATLRALSTRGLVTKNNTEYVVSLESMKFLGITKVEDLPEYNSTREKLNSKIQEALNG